MQGGAIASPRPGGVSERRIVVALLFAAIYTLTVYTLSGRPEGAGWSWIIATVAGGAILARLVGWKPALVLALALMAAGQAGDPWEGAMAGRPADAARMIVCAGGALVLVFLLWGMRKAAGRTAERYRVVVESASDGILITDDEGNYLWANTRALEMFGYTRVDMLDLNLAHLVSEEDLRALPIQGADRRTGAPVLRECRAWRKTGEALTLEISCRSLMDGRFIAMMRDVTERKRAENALKASLREKEVLLREIHHRVKNNLQIVSSLLKMHSRYVHDEEALARFTDSLERIKSIALLHERLYLSKDLARIDFAEYAPNLVDSLAATYGANADKVLLEVDVKDVSLELETAVPCGLILTELVTNALKYAFPGSARGSVRIRMEGQAKDDTVCLVVADTGVGMPEAAGRPDSLGMKLVTTLVKQLHGEMEIERSHGTQVTIRFPRRTAGSGGGPQGEDREDYERAITADSGR
jgi:PAS domain S-box-containing protein